MIMFMPWLSMPGLTMLVPVIMARLFQHGQAVGQREPQQQRDAESLNLSCE